MRLGEVLSAQKRLGSARVTVREPASSRVGKPSNCMVAQHCHKVEMTCPPARDATCRGNCWIGTYFQQFGPHHFHADCWLSNLPLMVHVGGTLELCEDAHGFKNIGQIPQSPETSAHFGNLSGVSLPMTKLVLLQSVFGRALGRLLSLFNSGLPRVKHWGLAFLKDKKKQGMR